MRHTAPPAAPLCRRDTLRGAELNGRDRHRLYCQLRLLYVLDGLPEGDAAVPEADRSCITRAAEGVERELRQFRWVLEALTDAEACRLEGTGFGAVILILLRRQGRGSCRSCWHSPHASSAGCQPLTRCPACCPACRPTCSEQANNLEGWRRADGPNVSGLSLKERFEQFPVVEAEEGGWHWGRHCAYCRHKR